MLDKNNEVLFGEYCKTCKYKNYSETDSPCAECLAEPVNLYSHKPVKWEGADGIYAGPPPRPDHAYQRAVKYVPEKRKDREKAIARQNIDAEYTGNKVQTIDDKVTDDQYPSATAVKKALEGANEATAQSLARKIDAPDNCDRGEFLAVEEVNEDGVVTKVKGAKVDPKSIKDMYYSEVEPLLTWTNGKPGEYYVVDADIELVVGNRYIVSINGKEYAAIAEVYETGWHVYSVGIGKYSSDFKDFPFVIYVPCGGINSILGRGKITACFDDADAGAEIKLYKEVVHTINEKYFPNTIFSQGNAPVKFGKGKRSAIQGLDTTASGDCSHAEGNITNASGNSSHAEGRDTTASGDYSHAEGTSTTASGHGSHAEGNITTASGDISHAEGGDTIASGDCSHAEGISTTASGNYSHAEGSHTTASGNYSHAEGGYTTASNKYQFVSGKYNKYDNRKYTYYEQEQRTFYAAKNTMYAASNGFTFDNATGIFTLVDPINYSYNAIPSYHYVIENKRLVYIKSKKSSSSTMVIYNATYMTSTPTSTVEGEYVHIVGNGTSDSDRSNAYTLDWDGNAWFAGDVYVGSKSGTNNDDGSVRLATVEDIPTGFIVDVFPDENNDDAYISPIPPSGIIRAIYGPMGMMDSATNLFCVLCSSPEDIEFLQLAQAHIIPLGSNAFTLIVEFSANVSGENVSVRMQSTVTNGDNGEEESDVSVTVTRNKTISAPATAAVGQIFKVKAVDADGKITETEAVTMPEDVIIQSSTEGSTKKFKITVDDSGTISATEVTT